MPFDDVPPDGTTTSTLEQSGPGAPIGAPDATPSTGRSGRRLRIAVGAGAAALLIAGGGFAAWTTFGTDDESVTESAMPTFEDRVVEVTTGTIGESVSAQGTVANAESADLSFEVAGTVSSVAVEAGDVVSAGQVLATVDSAALEAALAEAEAQLAEAEAALDDAESNGATDTAVDVAAAAVVTAQDSVDAAAEDLSGASLVAGFDGLVAAVDLTVGEQLGASGTGGTSMTGTASGSGRSASSSVGSASSAAQAGAGQGSGAATTSSGSEPQIQLISQGRFTVELAVAAADIADVAVGQDVDLEISTTASGSSDSNAGGFSPPGMQGGFGPPGMSGGGPGSATASAGSSESVAVTGSVATVGRVADASSGVATYAVTVTFTDDSGEIWAGSTTEADIHVSDRDDVTVVESMAVSVDGGDSTVTVALDGTVDGATEVRTVTTGETSGNMTEIVDGVAVGELVVVTAPSFGGPSAGGPSGGAPPGGPGDSSGPGGIPSGMSGGQGATQRSAAEPGAGS